MYINKYTHEISACIVKGIDWIEVHDGATFATGTSFDCDFTWRKDRYYMNKKETWVETSVSLNNLEMFTDIELLWIHPDVKQKMLKGEIPNQITEREWMRFDYSKLVGCVINYCGEDWAMVEYDLRYPVSCFVVANDSGVRRFVLVEVFLNNCYFYLEDGTMVSFEEYKGVYYND